MAPALATARTASVRPAVVDRELVAATADGRANFELLLARANGRSIK
jgi:ATP-dependent DNA ligase